MRSLILCAAVLSLSSFGAFAQNVTDDVNYTENEPLYEVEVTAGKLNLRAGADVSKRILRILDKGTKLTVVEANGDWVRVVLPEDTNVWVHSELVEQQDELTAVVKKSEVNIRASDSVMSSSVASLPEGSILAIVGKNDDGSWLKIKAPIDSYGWVAKKYTKEISTIEQTRHYDDIEAAFELQKNKSVDEGGWSNLLNKYKKIESEIKDPSYKQEVQERINYLEDKEALHKKYKEILLVHKKELETKLEQINVQHNSSLESVLRKHSTVDNDKQYYATGTLVTVGWVENRPTYYKLVKDDETICYVKSDMGPDGLAKFNLSDYYKALIKINGAVEDLENFEEDLVTISEIDIVSTD